MGELMPVLDLEVPRAAPLSGRFVNACFEMVIGGVGKESARHLPRRRARRRARGLAT